MRFLLGLLAGLVAFASALSSTGNKLLVVIEELADKEKYSHFWADLEGILLAIILKCNALLTMMFSTRLPINVQVPKRHRPLPLPTRRPSLLPRPHPPTKIERSGSAADAELAGRLCQRGQQHPLSPLERAANSKRPHESAAGAGR